MMSWNSSIDALTIHLRESCRYNFASMLLLYNCIHCKCASRFLLYNCVTYGSNYISIATKELNQCCHSTTVLMYVGTVVVCTDLWGKEPHKQVGMGMLVTSGKPMLCTLAGNARDVGSIPIISTLFPHFVTPRALVVWPWSCRSYALYGCWTCSYM